MEATMWMEHHGSLRGKNFRVFGFKSSIFSVRNGNMCCLLHWSYEVKNNGIKSVAASTEDKPKVGKDLTAMDLLQQTSKILSLQVFRFVFFFTKTK